VITGLEPESVVAKRQRGSHRNGALFHDRWYLLSSLGEDGGTADISADLGCAEAAVPGHEHRLYQVLLRLELSRSGGNRFLRRERETRQRLQGCDEILIGDFLGVAPDVDPFGQYSGDGRKVM
jgi:hypothetical protein